MRGMGPDGRHLDGPEFIRFLFEMAMSIHRGTYPMRHELGSRLHERVGEPQSPVFDALLILSIAEVFEQIKGGVALVRVVIHRDGTRTVRVDVHLIQTIDGAPIRLEGVRVL